MSIRKKEYTLQEKQRFAFKKGWRSVRVNERYFLKKEIKEALNLCSDMAFYSRMYGRTIPNVIEFEKIEKIFLKYGVKKCWGL